MSTPDLSSPAAVAAFLRQYNTWRRDESELDAPDRPKMPAPADLGRVIDAAVRMLESRPTPHGRSDDLLIQNLRARTWPGDCEAAAFRIEELLARVDELEAGPAPRDGHARQQDADAIIGLRSCNSLHGSDRTGGGMLGCLYRMRVTDPGCTGCVDRDEDQSAEGRLNHGNDARLRKVR